MFHVNNNLYFGRTRNGSVRMVQFKSRREVLPNADSLYGYSEINFDITIEPKAWASIVAEVSSAGAAGGRFYIAQAFHQNPPSPNMVQDSRPWWDV